MGASLPGPHRCFNMRNPFARALALTAGILFLGLITVHSETIDMRTVIIKTVSSSKNTMGSQQPLGGYQHDKWNESWHTPVEEEHTNDTETAGGRLFSNSSRVGTCDYEMTRLRKWQEKYQLQDHFEYTKRYVQPVRQDIPRKSITNLGQDFLTDHIKVVDVNKKYQPERCPEPLTVPVSRSPFPSTVNASDFMFGVSTTYKRFSDPLTSPVKEWTYWLTDGNGTSNGGKLILMLLDASDDDLDDASDQLTDAGIDVDLYRSDPSMPMAVRYLTLVPTMYDSPEREGKKWLVTCDDDTFFPSFHALAQRFEEYDHDMPMYIGTFSEDVNNIARHGSQAFGGAGVFLSVSLAEAVADNYESCITDEKIREADSGWGPQGDILLRKCIYENTDTKLTLLNDLWQLDLYGDPSGFYESGIKPLSLHHYRGGGWHIAHPWHYTKVARVCGEDCTLQRFRTADDFIISNSFSVAHYPRGIDFDVHQFERTFSAAPEDKGWNLDFAFGPQRLALHKTGRKISWDLQEAVVEDDGSVSQVYVRKHDDWRWKEADGSPMRELDGVVELVWLPAREGQGVP
ncbi:hypothetical protein QBC47DRAFT_395945 [Echria macrotheca]|uniref:Fringe-like glycosyltransferase domain-containing protein n=1 Tax=Echria macrotheca TaxID=438768 RepID=A0AAJ0B356_9PEZI|nr:hypothetical protein QBC47DRAFT_395945 [Echria macrotheca]